jgi:GT2 family glycosyltransferase
MNICIIIPSYNLADKLSKCLDCILDTGYKKVTVIIFDNGSNPSLKQLLLPYQKKIKSLVFLKSSKNLGFAEANNRGIKFGLKYFKKVDYFLLLNNDAYVTKDFFNKSIKYLKQDYDLLSPYVFLTKNRGIDSKGINYYQDGTGTNRADNQKGNYLLPAACLFISNRYVRECFNAYSWLFIPCFESYVEDIELSLRAKLMGRKIFLIPEKIVYHDRSSTMKNQRHALFLGMRNQLWTIITTWTKTMIKNNISEIIRGQITDNIVYSLKFRNIFMLPIYIQTIRNSSKLLKIRKNIQKKIILNNPEDIFLRDKSITLTTHIKRSRTYKRLRQFFFK